MLRLLLALLAAPFLAATLAVAAAPEARAQGWESKINVDDFNGSVQHGSFLKATQWEGSSLAPLVVIACEQDRKRLFVRFDWHPTDEILPVSEEVLGAVAVEYQFDSGSVETKSFSSSQWGLLSPPLRGSKEGENFLSGMLDSKSFFIHFRKRTGDIFEAQFEPQLDRTGLQEMASLFKTHCGFDPTAEEIFTEIESPSWTYEPPKDLGGIIGHSMVQRASTWSSWSIESGIRVSCAKDLGQETLGVNIIWSHALLTEDTVGDATRSRLEYKFDQGKVETTYLKMTPNVGPPVLAGVNTFFFSYEKRDFLRKMLQGSSLDVRVITPSLKYVTAHFDLSDLPQALAGLEMRCGYDFGL